MKINEVRFENMHNRISLIFIKIVFFAEIKLKLIKFVR